MVDEALRCSGVCWGCMLFSSEEFELVRLQWGAATGCFNRIHQAGGLAYGEKLDRKQVDTLNSVCQHEFGIGISKG
jgi:hypothetical protein